MRRRLKQGVDVRVAFAADQLVRPERARPATDVSRTIQVRELYTSPQGLIEHKAHIGAALHKLFEHYADNHFMTIYSQPSPELIDLVKALHMERQIKWFSFVKGLDSSGN